MKRLFVLLAVAGLLTLTAGPALAGFIACPAQPAPGSTLECGVSGAEPEQTQQWEAAFADGTEVTGDVTTDEEGAGGLAVDIPDDPELAGTEFTVSLEEGGTYTGMVGPAEQGDTEAAGEDAAAEDDAEGEQVEERPDADSEIALGGGGTAGPSPTATLTAVLGLVLVLVGGGYLLRTAVRR